jgi:hypothetical protein
MIFLAPFGNDLISKRDGMRRLRIVAPYDHRQILTTGMSGLRLSTKQNAEGKEAPFSANGNVDEEGVF